MVTRRVTPTAIVCGLFATACADTLHVFYPATIRPRAFQEMLSKSAPGATIRVFGRYKDFKSRTIKTKPTAVLTKPLLVEQLPGYRVTLKGMREGHDDEAYVLLSVGAPVAEKQVAGSTVGAVDFLGRTEMDSLVRDMLSSSLQVKRVTKIEDLLPLLTFEMARAVCIPSRQVDYFEKVSNLDFHTTPVVSKRIGIVALAVRRDTPGNAIREALEAADEKLLTILGVTQWKKR